MKILIIGSEGFIGHYLFDILSKEHECYRADVVESSNKSRYFYLEKENTNYFDLFSNNSFDFCINTSGSADVSHSIKDPLFDCELNYWNVEKILRAISLTQKNCTFILFSSAAVYGDPEQLPINENCTKNPISPYGIHKSFAEDICKMYSEIYGIRTFVLRLFSVYGIGQKKMLLWDLVNKFIFNDNVKLFGTGEESRDFIHVLDVANIINMIVSKDMPGNIINVANGKQIKIRTVAEYVKQCLESKKDIVFSGDERKGDPKNWEADIDRLKAMGYIQSVTIEQGIKDYVVWAKEKLEINSNLSKS